MSQQAHIVDRDYPSVADVQRWRVKDLRHRWLARIRARMGNYFWLPCPVCQRPFGGQEWKDGDIVRVNPQTELMFCPGHAKHGIASFYDPPALPREPK